MAVSCGGRIDAATSATDPPLGVPRDQFVASVTAAICNSVLTCCAAAGLNPYDDYRQRVQGYWQTIFDYATQIRAQYDPVQAERCVGVLTKEWSQCADRKSANALSDDACATVFAAPTPREGQGGTCRASMDCAQAGANTIVCHNQASGTILSGTCVAHVLSDAGGICGGLLGTTLAECKAPLVCAPDQRCHAPSALGEACERLGGDTCEAGTVCDLTQATSRCRKAASLGDACKDESDCENFACIDQVCRALPEFSLAQACN